MNSWSPSFHSKLLQEKRDSLQKLSREYNEELEKIEESRRNLSRQRAKLMDLADMYDSDVTRYLHDTEANADVVASARHLLNLLREESENQADTLRRKLDDQEADATTSYQARRSVLMEEINDIEMRSKIEEGR